MTEEIKLDWSSAEVHDGKLVVSLEGKPEKDWKDAFKRTARLLGRGTGAEVRLTRGAVSLQPIKPGEEDRVHHFLESVLLQANSSVQTEQETDVTPSEKTAADEDSGSREDSEDDRMTQRLRSFG